MVNQERLDLLTAGLRSGRFKQTTGALHRILDGQVENCCLGVACTIAIENGLELAYLDEEDQRFYLSDAYDQDPDAPRSNIDYNQGSELPRKVRDWYGFDGCDPEILAYTGTPEEHLISAAHANDALGLTFNQIADAFDATYKEDASE